jgi:hypothetical protein
MAQFIDWYNTEAHNLHPLSELPKFMLILWVSIPLLMGMDEHLDY